LYDGAWQGVPKGTVAIRVPSTDWLNFAHAAAEGQQVSPGKQRHVDDADLAGTTESKNEQMTADQRIFDDLHERKVRHAGIERVLAG
jgi:hypothetical protein